MQGLTFLFLSGSFFSRFQGSSSVASRGWVGGVKQSAQHTGNFENFKTIVKPTKSQPTFYLSSCTGVNNVNDKTLLSPKIL